MKNQAKFTPHAAETWAAALAQFDPGDVNYAILKIGLSVDPFPDLAKIIQAAEERRRSRLGIETRGTQLSNSDKVVSAVARAFKLPLRPQNEGA